MNRTRIYVFLGSSTGLYDMMNAMDTVQLFSKGEYMVIFPDMMTYSQTYVFSYWRKGRENIFSLCGFDFREAEKYLWETGKMQCDESESFRRRARSLLVVVSTPPTENYENFTKIVREYNAKEPFNFTTPSLFHINNISKVGFSSFSISRILIKILFSTVRFHLCRLPLWFCEAVCMGFRSTPSQGKGTFDWWSDLWNRQQRNTYHRNYHSKSNL